MKRMKHKAWADYVSQYMHAFSKFEKEKKDEEREFEKILHAERQVQPGSKLKPLSDG